MVEVMLVSMQANLLAPTLPILVQEQLALTALYQMLALAPMWMQLQGVIIISTRVCISLALTVLLPITHSASTNLLQVAFITSITQQLSFVLIAIQLQVVPVWIVPQYVHNIHTAQLPPLVLTALMFKMALAWVVLILSALILNSTAIILVLTAHSQMEVEDV